MIMKASQGNVTPVRRGDYYEGGGVKDGWCSPEPESRRCDKSEGLGSARYGLNSQSPYRI